MSEQEVGKEGGDNGIDRSQADLMTFLAEGPCLQVVPHAGYLSRSEHKGAGMGGERNRYGLNVGKAGRGKSGSGMPG